MLIKQHFYPDKFPSSDSLFWSCFRMSSCLSTGRARRRETSLSGLRDLRAGRSGTMCEIHNTYKRLQEVERVIY